jgi:hypothetical protein
MNGFLLLTLLYTFLLIIVFARSVEARDFTAAVENWGASRSEALVIASSRQESSLALKSGLFLDGLFEDGEGMLVIILVNDLNSLNNGEIPCQRTRLAADPRLRRSSS